MPSLYLDFIFLSPVRLEGTREVAERWSVFYLETLNMHLEGLSGCQRALDSLVYVSFGSDLERQGWQDTEFCSSSRPLAHRTPFFPLCSSSRPSVELCPMGSSLQGLVLWHHQRCLDFPFGLGQLSGLALSLRRRILVALAANEQKLSLSFNNRTVF